MFLFFMTFKGFECMYPDRVKEGMSGSAFNGVGGLDKR